MNTLQGTLCDITSSHGIHQIEVSVEGHVCCALFSGSLTGADWPSGAAVRLACSEQDVSLARHLGGELSIRNILPVQVVSLTDGEILTRVELALGAQRLYAVITRRSAERLALQPGLALDALIKASAMLLLEGET